MKRSEMSWISTAIYIIWAISIVLVIGGLLVTIHFIRKFW